MSMGYDAWLDRQLEKHLGESVDWDDDIAQQEYERYQEEEDEDDPLLDYEGFCKAYEWRVITAIEEHREDQRKQWLIDQAEQDAISRSYDY